jgi:hypothetical protein
MGQIDISNQKFKDGTCSDAVQTVQTERIDFLSQFSNNGLTIGACTPLKIKGNGDKTGDHNLNINAIANGNYTSEVMRFKNESACIEGRNIATAAGKLLLLRSGDTITVEAFCVAAEDD